MKGLDEIIRETGEDPELKSEDNDDEDNVNVESERKGAETTQQKPKRK